MNVANKDFKNFIKIIIILSITVFCVYAFYLPYYEIKLESIKTLNAEQKVLGKQAAESIQEFFKHYTNALNYMTKLPEVIFMNSAGETRLKELYESHISEIKAVTRIDSSGRIIYTVPYNKSSIGADVSTQEHNRNIIQNQTPVVSEVFRAVQGYDTVAYAYPVFRDNKYDGCLTVLIPFDLLAGKHLSGIRVRNEGYAWMLSKNGVEIYCPLKTHMGRTIYETSAGFPSVIAMAEKMMKGEEGSAINEYKVIADGAEKFIRKHAVYLPVRLPGSFWSIAVETPESEVLSSMESFKNKWLFIMFVFCCGIFIYFYYFIKARAVLKEEETRKKAEEAVRASEKKYSELAESLPLPVFEFNLNGTFTYVNNTGLQKFGYTSEDLARGKNVSEMLVPGDRERAVSNILKRLKGEETEQEEFTALKADGTTFPFIVDMGKILNNEKITGMRGVIIDISDRKMLEAELLKAQRLESIGILAGGIAHDFNNLLMVIFGNTSLIKSSMKDDDPDKGRIENIVKAAQQAADLTKQLLTFSKGGKPVKKLINLNEIIRESLIFALSGTGIDYEFPINKNLWSVDADPGQMKQVFNNLIINSCQSMPGGGMVKISVENMEGESTPGFNNDFVKKIKITLQDQGAGIPAENIDRIFDPYFTTKNKGSGLGLSVIYSIIKSHDGLISVDSEVGKGTVFTIILPAVDVIINRNGDDPDAIIKGTGRILFMDDEEMIRIVTLEMLKELGYDIELAKDGTEAYEVYKKSFENGRPFDAVILDITIMGGMGGKDTLRELVKIDPSVKAIASSGYSGDPVISDYKSFGFCAFIPKPYNLIDLGRMLHDVCKKR